MKKIILIASAVLISACATKPAPRDETYPKANVRKTIRTHMNEVNACYGSTLRRDPKIEGKVVLKFTINGEGQVVNLDPIKESSTVSDSGFVNCLRQTIAFWKFPNPPADNDVEVTYPFQFKSHTETLTLDESEE